ncbi:hypothetical protein [Anaerotruncus sp. 80]|uniref:hypothetical protein n=1 Tax=Anaerotruncus sp. 80 TaxID=2304566 RepID=UPI001A9BB9F4|nr:hypothetical protein [Anaerotruncus sp. 80]
MRKEDAAGGPLERAEAQGADLPVEICPKGKYNRSPLADGTGSDIMSNQKWSDR